MAPARETDPERQLERLGPLRLVRLLGRGSMGRVYEAELEEARPYAHRRSRLAVKVLHPELTASPEGVERFHREAELGTGIRHPAIVRTFEAAKEETDRGPVHYLVLEYVEGVSVRRLLDELGSLPEALLRDLALQLALGLEAVHAVGAVHRDLKPENVLLTPDHRVKLMDLGVARLQEPGETLTRFGHFVGSALYAAPEQFEGEGIGPSADLYALGVLLHEGATGHQPFRAETFHAILRRHLEVVPPKIGRLQPQFSPFFEEVISRLLEKRPEDRFASSAELARVLEQGESGAWWKAKEDQLRASSGGLRRFQVARAGSLVGRDDELAYLEQAFDRARAGAGGLVLVEGEAGVGKTHLLEAFATRLEERHDPPVLLHGSYEPGGPGLATGALSEAVVEHFGASDLERRLMEESAIPPTLAPTFAAALLGEPPPPGQEPLRLETLQVLFGRLLRGLARTRPVVWIVEDLHMGNADGRALLASMARTVRNLPVLVLATIRPGLPTEEVAALTEGAGTAKLALGRLEESEVTQMVEELVGSRELAERLGEQVARRSGGNPYFALEILHDLEEKGILRRDPSGVAHAEGPIGELDVPTTVRELLRSHIETLKEEDRTLLEAASVQGHQFDPSLCAAVLQERPLAVLQSLARLERRLGLVRAAGSSFRFDHHQLREILYESMPTALRQEYHRQLALAYLAAHPETRDRRSRGEVGFFLSEHFLRGGDVEAAVPWLVPTLRFLERQSRSEGVLSLTRLALDALGEESPAVQDELWIFRAEALVARARGQEALEAARRAREVAGTDELGLRARQAEAKALMALNRREEAEAELRKTAREARDENLRSIEARALANLCNLLGERAAYNESREMLHRQLELAEQTGDIDIEIVARTGLGNQAIRLGQYREARRELEELLALPELEERPHRRTVALANLGVALANSGHYEESRPRYEELLHLARESGTRSHECLAYSYLGNLARALGDLPTARRRHLQGLELACEVDYRLIEVICSGALGSIALDLGRWTEAAERLETAVELARENEHADWERRGTVSLGLLAQARGEAGRAEELIRTALEGQRVAGEVDSLAESCLALGRLLLEEGRREEAVALLREAASLCGNHDLADPGPVPRAWLAAVGAGSPEEVEVGEGSPHLRRIEAHLALHEAGGAADHLTLAGHLLEEVVSRLEPDEQERFRTRNHLARAHAAAHPDRRDRVE